METIFSNGKLLLTSEYVVLGGAKALAVPTKMGQKLSFSEQENGKSEVFWESFCQNQLWLRLKFEYENWQILETNDEKSAEFIVSIFKEIQRKSVEKLQNNQSYIFQSDLDFPRNFGLGSSSTLMNNLATWAEIDPFDLNEKTLGGSGYDVAVAKEKHAILYQIKDQKREIKRVEFCPEFRNDLLFIHLNQKQDSRKGIHLYRSKNKSEALISEFSDLTKKILNAQTLEEFSHLMQIHEEKLADFLGLEKVKDIYFKDCPSFVKSLGAWGGDFVMSHKFENYQSYFKEKGFDQIFTWQEMISEN